VEVPLVAWRTWWGGDCHVGESRLLWTMRWFQSCFHLSPCDWLWVGQFGLAARRPLVSGGVRCMEAETELDSPFEWERCARRSPG